ncbi:MAG TPA: Gfo/Idh/MocA family oxidoreductase [Bacteroidales bacterium]|nr:Gfo/Idh/MocA family oxidoreductase [Bacteroidales bacterium]HPT22862.1 Gfo/Idh/MocA family oxidoreductase [Bacteroidales bacterium]
MEKEKDQPKKSEVKNEVEGKTSIRRRTLLKALVGVPVLGAFTFELLKKYAYDQDKKNRIIQELGLENIQAPVILKSSSGAKSDLIRIGLIGFGNRAVSHANGLGYMHPDDVAKRKANNTLDDWMAQEDLNVAITGICDVFDLHAENGLTTARSETRAGGAKSANIPVKRYRTYQEMLDDKDIDAVMIATPDHSHAPIATAAAKAGKHIYCEKAPAHSEEQLYELYDTVKNSKVVYQLGHQVPQSVVFQQAKDIIKKDILGKITLVETTTNRNTADGAWIRNLDKNGNPKPGDEKSIDWKQWLCGAPDVPFSLDRYYNWTKYFDYDIGLIGQLFTHEFDAVNQLLRIGIPKYVVSSGGLYFWKDNRDMPDTLHCVFEYPNHDLTLLYTASLASSRSRGRVFMGHDASMELGGAINITADADSTRYKKQIEAGLIDPSGPMVSFNPNSGKIDAVTTATEKYYASRGLTTTTINGRAVDVTHLHIKEWIDCIRSGKTPSANIEMAFQEGVACLMAHKSYLEKRRTEWDPVNRRIV